MAKPELTKAQWRLLKDMKDGTPLVPILGGTGYTIKGRRVRPETGLALTGLLGGPLLVGYQYVIAPAGLAALEGEKE